MEVHRRLLDEDVPQAPGLVIAGLQHDDALAGALLERVGAIEGDLGLLVEGGQIAGRELGRRFGLADVEEMLDEHAELQTPVADVVLPRDRVTDEGQRPHQRVADDRRTQMTDVHLLGDVRRRVVDDDALWRRRESNTETAVARLRGELRGDELVSQGQVDETRTGDLDVAAHAVEIDTVDDRLSDVTGVAAKALGQRQHAVGLVVGPVRWSHDRIGARFKAVERRLQALAEKQDGVGHR